MLHIFAINDMEDRANYKDSMPWGGEMVSSVDILSEKTSNSDSGRSKFVATATSTEAKTVWILHFRADS
jgi:hypothetical protein